MNIDCILSAFYSVLLCNLFIGLLQMSISLERVNAGQMKNVCQPNIVFMCTYLQTYMKCLYILTKERSPSCLPCNLHLLPSFYKAYSRRLPDSILSIHCLTPYLLVILNSLLYSYLPSLHLPQGLCICCPFAKTLFCQIVSQLPLLILFTHLQGVVS